MNITKNPPFKKNQKGNPNENKNNQQKENNCQEKNIHLTKKITQNNKLINKILAYYAKKIKANPPAPYSILKPETNSDSDKGRLKHRVNIDSYC
jgi:tRNA A37 threonylcarbamoyladenosine synthetase subunit TsaC/SUA5/YrdC